jgi:hypothetical protein
MKTETSTDKPKPLPGMLEELRDLQLKTETIKEKFRGPGRHFVFMALMDAVIGLRRAVDEEYRISEAHLVSGLAKESADRSLLHQSTGPSRVVHPLEADLKPADSLVESEKDAWLKVDEAADVVAYATRKHKAALDEWGKLYSEVRRIRNH